MKKNEYDVRPCVASCRHALMLAATQPNAKINSNPNPEFPRVVFTRQIDLLQTQYNFTSYSQNSMQR